MCAWSCSSFGPKNATSWETLSPGPTETVGGPCGVSHLCHSWLFDGLPPKQQYSSGVQKASLSSLDPLLHSGEAVPRQNLDKIGCRTVIPRVILLCRGRRPERFVFFTFIKKGPVILMVGGRRV